MAVLHSFEHPSSRIEAWCVACNAYLPTWIDVWLLAQIRMCDMGRGGETCKVLLRISAQPCGSLGVLTGVLKGN